MGAEKEEHLKNLILAYRGSFKSKKRNQNREPLISASMFFDTELTMDEINNFLDKSELVAFSYINFGIKIYKIL